MEHNIVNRTFFRAQTGGDVGGLGGFAGLGSFSSKKEGGMSECPLLGLKSLDINIHISLVVP